MDESNITAQDVKAAVVRLFVYLEGSLKMGAATEVGMEEVKRDLVEAYQAILRAEASQHAMVFYMATKALKKLEGTLEDVGKRLWHNHKTAKVHAQRKRWWRANSICKEIIVLCKWLHRRCHEHRMEINRAYRYTPGINA